MGGSVLGFFPLWEESSGWRRSLGWDGALLTDSEIGVLGVVWATHTVFCFPVLFGEFTEHHTLGGE